MLLRVFHNKSLAKSHETLEGFKFETDKGAVEFLLTASYSNFNRAYGNVSK